MSEPMDTTQNQAQHLAAIEAAVQVVNYDTSVPASTKALLLALAAYATGDLRSQVQEGDRWETFATS